jgi:hypothetical protein
MKKIFLYSVMMAVLFSFAACEIPGLQKPEDQAKQTGVNKNFGECSMDSDCENGFACNEPIQKCIAVKPSDSLYAVNIIPSAQSGFLAEQFDKISFKDTNKFDVTLSDPITVSGKIVKSDFNFYKSLPGKLYAYAPAKIEGAPYYSETISTSEDKPDKPAGYKISLLPGIEYTFVFYPYDVIDPNYPEAKTGDEDYSKVIPPFVFNKTFSASVSDFDILLPEDETYQIVSGIVVMDLDSLTPVQGALVKGLSGAVQSTSSRTDKLGRFKIVFPVKTSDISISVEPTKDSISFPTYNYKMQNLKSFSGGNEDVVYVPVGPLPKDFELKVLVLGKVSHETDSSDQGSEEPVQGAVIKLQGSVNSGIYSVTDSTDENGVAVLKVLSSKYYLTVVPSVNSDFAVHEGYFDGDYNEIVNSTQGMNTIKIFLDRKKTVSGKVVASDGSTPVANAHILAMTSENKANKMEESALTEREYASITDANGNFTLKIDKGNYSVVVIPEDTSLQPRFNGLILSAQNDINNVKVVLPEPTLVLGKITAGNKKGLAGAKIEFYLTTVQEGGSHLEPGFIGSQSMFVNIVQLTGAGFTQDEGKYFVIMPVTSGWTVEDGDQATSINSMAM